MRSQGERDGDKHWEIENQRNDKDREENPSNGRTKGEIEEGELQERLEMRIEDKGDEEPGGREAKK